jgi:hypothetical protein
MRSEFGSVPQIVEVAYTRTEFGKIDEDRFQEATDWAKSTGVTYEIDKLYLKDFDRSAERTLRGRILALGGRSIGRWHPRSRLVHRRPRATTW